MSSTQVVQSWAFSESQRLDVCLGDDCLAEVDKIFQQPSSPNLLLLEIQCYFKAFNCLKILRGLTKYTFWCTFLYRSQIKSPSLLLPFPPEEVHAFS